MKLFVLKPASRRILFGIFLSLPILLAFQNCGRTMTAMEYQALQSLAEEDPDIYKQISVGGNFACGVLDSGFVKCWGQNHFGQLGNGTTIDSNVPVQVVGLSNVASVHVSTSGENLPDSFACALLLDGKAKCWGNNEYGQLGMGLTGAVDSSGNVFSALPLEVLSVSGATQMSVGSSSTCVVLTDKTAKCWGNLNSGFYKPLAIAVNGLTNIKKISAQVALLSISEEGVLRSTALTSINSAAPFSTKIINNIPLAKDFSAEGFNYCVVSLEGGVTCRGLPNFLNIFEPDGGVQTLDLEVENAKSIVVSQKTACVRFEDDSLKCLGKNSAGALGNNSLVDSTELVPVSEIAKVSDVSAGSKFTCALDQTGLAYCWGLGINGQLGNKNHSNYNVSHAQKIIQDDIKSMSLSDGHSCALLNDRTVTCWGSDYVGQLGDGGTSRVGQPYFHWEKTQTASSTDSVVPKKVENLSGVVKLASSLGRTCALLSTGQVKCWGYNFHRFQDDDSVLLNDSVPVLVPNLNDAMDIASDGYLGEFCVIRSDKGVWCFGVVSIAGMAGGQATIIADSPIETGLDNINFIRVNTISGVCGVTADAAKTIKCWVYGQPVFTLPITDVAAFSNVANYSNDHFCAILTTGKVKCKVNGVFVDAGPAIDGEPSLVREIITYRSTVYDIPVMCFLEESGRVTCNKGHTPATATTEVLNADSSDAVVSIFGGYSHACAVLRSGNAKCWGSNADGALGSGFKSIVQFPVRVDN